MRSMRSERWAVIGGLVAVVLLGVPVFAFAASIRGGGVGEGNQSIHVKLDQPSGGVASGTISYMVTGTGGGVFSATLTVTGGDLTTGTPPYSLSGTFTLTQGAPATLLCVDEIFDAAITPGGAGVGRFLAVAGGGPPCGGHVFDVLLEAGNIVFLP